MLTLLTALALLSSSPVEVELKVSKPLKLDRKKGLTGALEVQVSNTGAEPVTLQHRDVHSLRFEPRGSDAGTALLFHSCDCGFELGLEPPPAARTFTLQPGEQRTFTFAEFSCDGGPFEAPPPGKYLLTFSVGPPGPPPRRQERNLAQCRSQLQTRPPEAHRSAPLAIELRR